jgi:group I intron endonuclease
MTSAIYRIRNIVSGRVYVGSAVNVQHRWQCHRHRLRKGNHHSASMQSSWNKHGADAFSFEIIELCDPSDFIKREQFWIDALNSCDPRLGFNMCPAAGSPLGLKRQLSEAVKKNIGAAAAAKNRTPEMREKVRASKLAYYKNPENLEKLRAMALKYWATRDRENATFSMTGRKHSDATRAKMSASRSGKIFGPLSEEHKIKLRRSRSEETKAKMRAAWVLRRAAKQGGSQWALTSGSG